MNSIATQEKTTTGQGKAVFHHWAGPLATVRVKCFECCSGRRSEVAGCVSLNCYLWPYRFGMSPATAKKQDKLIDPKEAADVAGVGGDGKLRGGLYRKDGKFISVHRAIRLHCLDCAPDKDSEYSTQEVRNCTAPYCPLYPFRFGVRPKTAEKWGRQV